MRENCTSGLMRGSNGNGDSRPLLSTLLVNFKTPCNGDFLRIYATFRFNVRIVCNELVYRISYVVCRELRTLPFIIYYCPCFRRDDNIISPYPIGMWLKQQC